MIVFISYNSSNHDPAQALAVQLGMLGHDVWFEEKVIGGDVGWHQVFEGIHDCDAYAIVATQFSLESPAQQLEFGYAKSLGKPILQVLLENPTSEAALARISGVPFVDYRHGNTTLPQLAEAFAKLPTAEAQTSTKAIVLRPELVASLTKLHEDVTRLPKDEVAQFTLFYNLREFLERYETFYPARNVLLELQGHPAVSRRVAKEIANTFKEVKRLRVRRKALRRRNKILKDVAVVVGVPIMALGFVKGGQMIPTFFASETPAAAVVALSISSTSTAEPILAEQTAKPIIALSASSTPTDEPETPAPFTNTPAPTSTETIAATSTPVLPTATIRVPEATATPIEIAANIPLKSANKLKLRVLESAPDTENSIDLLLKALKVPRRSLLSIKPR